ncbi:MAG TPA: hypothetical protein VGF44_04570 [Terriglobales bacterium]
MKKKTTYIVLFVALIVAAVAFRYERRTPDADRLLLLIPDGMKFSDAKVRAWTDAGEEEGLHIVPVHDSEFLRPVFGQSQCAGLILPDSIHKQASDLVVSSIKQFVSDGGKLMLVFDAGTLSNQGRYEIGSSRLSDLAGVKYALYDDLRDKAIRWSDLKTDNRTIREFDVPPGKYYPFSVNPTVNLADIASPAAGGPAPSVPSSSIPTPIASQPFEVTFKRYKFGDLQYPNFVTAGNFAGKELFHSDAGVAVGEHQYGHGYVLFVNLPVGYLKTMTDGLPLHIFLKYFASHSLSLPYLMSVPDGTGGLVLNWHVDSNAAIKPLQQMDSWSLLKQGPYSVHITAGPDAVNIGDKLGVDAEHNPIIQEYIRKYISMGYTVGSHGGWIHNYFSAHIETDSPAYMQQFLALNKAALEKDAGRPVVEYSAPNGDQPVWVTQWLEAHGFIAYYFTGDSGMGPTEVYRDGDRTGHNIWAFPTLHLDRAAAFEEFPREGYSDDEVASWLGAVTNFVSDHRVVRLVYFHPPGILRYQPVIDQWAAQTLQLKNAGQFRWYTMTEMANFLNARKSVQWKFTEKDGNTVIEMQHPVSLQHLTWWFPLEKFARPKLPNGGGSVTQSSDGWMVTANDVKNLEITARMIP